MKKMLTFISAILLSCTFLSACSKDIYPTNYLINSDGNLIVVYDDGATEDLGEWGDEIINSLTDVSISEDGYYIINGIKTNIIAVETVSYELDNDGNLIVTYSDGTTENLGPLGDSLVNGLESITVSEDGYYIINGIKTNIVAKVSYDVSFYAGYSFSIPSQKVLEGKKITRPEIDRTGYTLEGWYCNGEEWRFNSDIVLNDMKLVAEWTANKYTITFKNDMGVNPENMVVTFGEYINLPSLEDVQGYTFNGWYYNNSKITSGIWEINEDCELIANWSRDTYKVYFNTDGGNSIPTMIVDSYSTIEKLPIPTKDEFEFLGWYCNNEKINMPYEFTEGDITLKALWRGLSEDYEFTEENGEIKLIKYKGNDVNVIVPKTLGGKKVTSISANCFTDSIIESIEFHSNIINFEYKSINGCASLNTLTLSSEINVDLAYIFGGESNIPSDLVNIHFCIGSINVNSSIFNNISVRKFEVWTNSDLKILKEDAFYECNAVTKLHLNEGLTKIETTAIWNMDYLTYVNIPSTLYDIGWSNFGNCPKLLYLICPKTITNTTHQSLVASDSVVLVEYESMPSTWDSTTFGYDITVSKMSIFYGFEKLVETDEFLYALCKVGTTKRCIIIQRFDSSVEFPEFIEDYPVTFTNNDYTTSK